MSLRTRQHRAGFTLVEILVVVVILGIASVVILPQLGGRADLEAASAARMLTADLIYTQNLAIVRQRPHYLRFDGNTYSVWTRDSGGNVVRVKHPVRHEDFIVTLGAGGNVGLARASINAVAIGTTSHKDLGFDELGSPMACNVEAGTAAALTSSARVTIASGEFSIAVNVEPFTGEVTVD